MNSKMRSSVMGLILGRFSSPLPEVQKEPVAYLYNGVRLPALPEWDREKYPYAWISKAQYNDDYYSLIISTGECDYRLWNDKGISYYLYPVDVPITIKAAYLYEGEFETGEWNFTWEKTYEENIVHSSAGLGLPVWSNFDVMNHYDGTVYCAASKPIPIYGSIPEPTGYLYNGVQLPPLPEWDKKTYPYAAIGIIYKQSYYTFIASDKQFTSADDGYISWMLSAPVMYDNTSEHPNEWTSRTSVIISSLDYVWSNHEVFYSSNSKVVAHYASEPVPVYE